MKLLSKHQRYQLISRIALRPTLDLETYELIRDLNYTCDQGEEDNQQLQIELMWANRELDKLRMLAVKSRAKASDSVMNDTMGLMAEMHVSWTMIHAIRDTRIVIEGSARELAAKIADKFTELVEEKLGRKL